MVKLFVCKICGEPYIGENIDDCPFCGAPKNYLKPAEDFEEIWNTELNEKEKEDLKETLKLEINAAAYYDKVSSSQTKYSRYNRLFKQLARVEKEHVEIASKFLKSDIPELEGEDVRGIKDDLKRTEELEQEAIKKYQKFLTNAENSNVKNFYIALIHAEKGHEEIVSK